MLVGLKTVLIGMRITLKHLFTPPVTMHYPDERWKMPEAYRGLIKVDMDACIVCDLCMKACPVDCIDIQWKREPGVQGKIATKFTVDYQKCIVCGLCTEPCPTLAIFHSHEYEVCSYDRSPQIIDWTLPSYKTKNPKAKPMKKAEKPKPQAAPKGEPAVATAVAAAPSGAGLITNVWIDPGCIVCDLCEDTCEEVFSVQEETCIVREESKPQWAALTNKIIQAADECPVNVIKYT